MERKEIDSERTLFEWPMPATPGARKFKTLLAIVAVWAVVGTVLAIRGLLDTTFDSRAWSSWTVDLLHVVMGIAILVITYRALRHNRAPSTLVIFTVVLLSILSVLLTSQAN